MAKKFKEVEETENGILITEVVDFSEVETVQEVKEEVQSIKIDLEEFVLIAKKNGIENAVETLKLEVEEYLSIKIKRILCKGIAESVLYSESGYYHYNEFDKHVSLLLGCVFVYTNLESTGDDDKDYDIINSSGLAPVLIEMIGSEYKECAFILDSILEEKINIGNSIEATISTNAYKLSNSLAKMIDRTDTEELSKNLGGSLESLISMISSNGGIMSLISVYDQMKELQNKKDSE